MIDPLGNYFVVDNNFAQRECLGAYLEENSRNFAVLPETVFEEWHGKKAMATTRHALVIACRHPDQVLVLRPTHELFRDRGDPVSLVERLIDRQQTRDFPAYCETVIEAPVDEALEQRFQPYEAHCRELRATLVPEARKIYAIFAREDAKFTQGELAELRGIADNPRTITGRLQRHTYLMAKDIARNMLIGNQLRRHELPPSHANFINSLAFRYGAMLTAYWVFRNSNPGPYPTRERDILATFRDLKIGAQATYFHGLKSNDRKLAQVFQFAMSLIRALEGYRDCGSPRSRLEPT
jgi:hypothetical protein